MPRDELFTQYSAMKTQRGDSDQKRREKLAAQEALAGVLSMLEVEGFTVEQKKSSIIFYCPHGDPKNRPYIRKVFPNPKEHKDGHWEGIVRSALRDHQRECGEKLEPLD